MFKLPICPHCGTVYRYKDTVKALKTKDNECYHCHKRFKASLLPGILVLGLITVAVSVGINLLILSRMTAFTLIPLFAVTIGMILIAAVVIPFFIRFKKIEEEPKYPKQKQTEKKKKK